MKTIISLTIMSVLLGNYSFAQSKYSQKKNKLPPTPVAELYTPALLTIWRSHGLMEDGIRLLLTTDGLHMHSIRNPNGKRTLYGARGADVLTATNDGSNFDMMANEVLESRINTKLVVIPTPPVSRSGEQLKTLNYWEKAKAQTQDNKETVRTQQGMEIKDAGGKIIGYISPTTYIKELVAAAEEQQKKELLIAEKIEKNKEVVDQEKDNRKKYVYFDHLGHKIANAIIIAENTLEIKPFDPNLEVKETQMSFYTSKQRADLKRYQPQLNKDRN